MQAARKSLFFEFLFFGAYDFLFHRVRAVCDRFLESLGIAFNDEVVSGNVGLNLDIFVFRLLEKRQSNVHDIQGVEEL